MLDQARNVFKRSVETVLFSLMVRVLIYAVLLGAIAYSLLWGAVVYDHVFFDELGPVEIAQTVFALSAALFFLLAAKRDSSKVPATVLITGVMCCFCIREWDYLLDEYAGKHAWKIGVTLVLLGMSVYLVSNLRAVHLSIRKFTHLPSFGVFLSGFLVLFAFSRLFGYGPFWKAIMDDSNYRMVKTIVEEGVETMGYFLILVSALEFFHEARIHTRSHQSKRIADPSN
ncbi:MAG: hypothetical protein FJ220_06685 [Kiritimatiellaceae bacterium]|nr:hypothetical protein [Kiritimatiellaceae bacterium]